MRKDTVATYTFSGLIHLRRSTRLMPSSSSSNIGYLKEHHVNVAPGHDKSILERTILGSNRNHLSLAKQSYLLGLSDA